MFAAMGGDHFQVITQTSDSTDTDTVLLFLKLFISKIREPIDTVSLVVDNHASHHSKRVKAYCLQVGLELVFLPPYSSTLNPVERLWAMVKHRWKKQMARLKCKYDHEKLT